MSDGLLFEIIQPPHGDDTGSMRDFLTVFSARCGRSFMDAAPDNFVVIR
ncbi:hypothetical protein [Streptomyces lunaelactis]